MFGGALIHCRLYAGPEVDVWSCGVILYALVCARLPFDDPHIPTLFRMIREGRYSIPPYVSSECRDLISKMLVVDLVNRATIADIRAHPWFQKYLPAYLRAPPSGPADGLPDKIDRKCFVRLAEVYGRLGISKPQLLAALQRPGQRSVMSDDEVHALLSVPVGENSAPMSLSSSGRRFAGS